MKYTHTEILVIRKSLFLTQIQFAKLLETHLTQVARWEKTCTPNPKWRERIKQKLREISQRVRVLKQLCQTNKDKYFVLFESDMVDYAAKQILYSTKIREGEVCYLVKFNRESYEKYTGVNYLSPAKLNAWAKYYHKLRESKAPPKKGESEYPWLTEWEA